METAAFCCVQCYILNGCRLCFACGARFDVLYCVCTHAHSYRVRDHSLNHTHEYQFSQNVAAVFDSCCLHTLKEAHRNRSIAAVFRFWIFRSFPFVPLHLWADVSVCARCVSITLFSVCCLFISLSFDLSFSFANINLSRCVDIFFNRRAKPNSRGRFNDFILMSGHS